MNAEFASQAWERHVTDAGPPKRHDDDNRRTHDDIGARSRPT